MHFVCFSVHTLYLQKNTEEIMSVFDSKYIMKVHFPKITTYNLLSNEKDRLNYFIYIMLSFHGLSV